MRHHTGEILAQPRADFAGEGARSLQSLSEVVRAVRKPEGFEFRRTTRRVFAHQYEIARVRHQHQPVAAPVSAHLIARRREPRIVVRRLHLNHAALRRLSISWSALLHLLRRVEAEVGMARALIGKFADTEHLRLERRAHGVQQVGERPVARPFPGRAARCAHSSEVSEIRLDRRRQFRVRSRHHPRCRRVRRDMQAPVQRLSHPIDQA